MSKPLLTTLALAAFILGCEARAMEFDKPIASSVVITKPTSNTAAAFSRQAQPLTKTVMLMKIKLTRQQRELLRETNTEKSEPNNNFKASATINLPRQVEVGMNGTPVLNQGQHGSCTTFAITAAIDALLGKGDYLSQLCNLELGSYFEQKGYLPSGWDGTSGPLVLNQIIGFGIVSTANQKDKSCGGLKEYPTNNQYNIGSPMPLDDYKQASENLNEKLDWHPILSFEQRFAWDPKNSAPVEVLLNDIKKELATKRPYEDSRLTFGSFIPVDYCSSGACASYHAEFDTWALSNAIKNDRDPTLAGHEMVITGYNDDAIAMDNEGGKHQGLLILRNSWGDNAGDQGNYYMSYDFFKKYVLEVQKIRIVRDQR